MSVGEGGRKMVKYCIIRIFVCVLFWVFPRRLIKIVVCRRFGTLYQFHLQRLDVRYEVPHIQPLKMELIECSETSAYYNFNQTPGKYPKEYIQNVLRPPGFEHRYAHPVASRYKEATTERP